MRWQGATVIVALMTIPMAVGQSPLVRIVLRDKVAVANATVRLGDIAEVTALSDEGEKLLTALRELPIAPSPLPATSASSPLAKWRRNWHKRGGEKANLCWAAQSKSSSPARGGR